MDASYLTVSSVFYQCSTWFISFPTYYSHSYVFLSSRLQLLLKNLIGAADNG